MARRKGKKTGRAKRVNHVGAIAGIAAFGANVMLSPETGKQGSTASAVYWLTGEPAMPINERIKRAQYVVIKNLKQPATYMPLAAGALVSVGKRLPLVRMVASPIDNAIANLTRGRWRL